MSIMMVTAYIASGLFASWVLIILYFIFHLTRGIDGETTGDQKRGFEVGCQVAD